MWRTAWEGAVRLRAVIFDLWDTLVEWPIREAECSRERLAALAAVGEDEFADRWGRSYRLSSIGPLAAAYRELGIPGEHLAGAGLPPVTSSDGA